LISIVLISLISIQRKINHSLIQAV